MAQIPLRLTLTSTGFPFLSEKQGRTIIIPGLDITGKSSAVIDPNLAVPEIYYGHNIVPTAQGFQAAALSTLVAAPVDTLNDFTQVLTIRDSAGNKVYLATCDSGRNYILRHLSQGWKRTDDILPAVSGRLVTTAYINGITYIYFEKIGCYTYDVSANTLNWVTLSGLVPAQIKGIVAAAGYLLAYSNTYMYWSSTLTPVDFTPSIITGAGGGAVQDLKGAITIVFPHRVGVTIYSTYNIVMGYYSGNIRFPFSFKEIVGSGGVSSNRHMDIDPVSGDHYAYTTGGVQLVTPTVTNGVFPELTDFLAGLYFEDFDENTNTFTTTSLTTQMVKRITSISDRYVIFSYGTGLAGTHFTYAVVYDVSLQRFGKLKLPHVDCFEYVLLDTDIVDNAKNSIGFLQLDGTVVLTSLSAVTDTANGVLLLGKFQVARQNTVDLEQLVIENVRPTATFSVTCLSSIDGKNISTSKAGYLIPSTGLVRDYRFRSSGMNHSLLFKGAFDLVSILSYWGLGGYR